MGYPDGVKGYRVRDRSSGSFFVSRDVLFDESGSGLDVDGDAPPLFDFSSSPEDEPVDDTSPPVPVDDALPSDLDSLPVVDSDLPGMDVPVASSPAPLGSSSVASRGPSSRVKHLSRLGTQYESSRALEKARSAKLSAAWHARHNAIDARVDPGFPPVAVTPGVSPPEAASVCEHLFRDDYANLVCEESAFLSIRSDRARNPAAASYDMSIPPATYAEARRRPDFATWDAVVQKEFHNLSSMGVYRLSALPPGRQPVGSRWVFEYKILETALEPKGRLVAKGFSQIPGIDFGKTFAPVAKATSIRLLAAIACHYGWHLECFDATRAFLWGDLEESIFMRLPDGFVPPTGVPLPPGCKDWSEVVWELLKSLYGLKQASMVWYVKIRGVFERLGFRRSEVDHSLFVFSGTWRGMHVECIITLHVDDGMGGSNSDAFLAWVKSEIMKEFGLKDLGPVKQFLGVEFVRNLASKELWMHQSSYIRTLLDDHDMSDCNPAKTPMDLARIDPGIDTAMPDRRTEFQTIIGKLLFLSICTRPDISYAVNSLAQHSCSPHAEHFTAIKRVLRYLKGTISLGLYYRADDTDSISALRGYSDSDWAGEKDRRSVSGYAWFYGKCLVDWGSKKQHCVALSSTEAEYVALTTCLQSGLALRSSITQINQSVSSPSITRCDNEGAISLSSNTSHHSRAKHIDIKFHFIRSHIEQGTFEIVHVRSKDNGADILTKPLPTDAHAHLVQLLSLVSR